MQIVEEIIYNFENNKSLYIGENITIADHMIQSAMLAEKAKCDDDLICSCLLHDYGHFVIDDPDKLVENNKNSLNDVFDTSLFHQKLEKIQKIPLLIYA